MRISDWSSDVCSSDLRADSRRSSWGYRSWRFLSFPFSSPSAEQQEDVTLQMGDAIPRNRRVVRGFRQNDSALQHRLDMAGETHRADARSDARRGGKGGDSPCSSRGCGYTSKQKNEKQQ